MKNIIVIIAFAFFAGTYSASAQEGTKTTTKKESCCVSTKSCTAEEKAKCLANPSCTAAEKANCVANSKAKTPAKKSRA